MAGELFIDTEDRRLAAINGHLVEDVKFGGGLLGHLKSGGQFHVERTNRDEPDDDEDESDEEGEHKEEDDDSEEGDGYSE